MTEDHENSENAVCRTDDPKPWQFKPGQSGNPAGKPKGTKHKATQAMMTLLEGETEALTRKAVELALEGDTTALKICLDRIAPAPKSSAQPVTIDLEKGATLTDTARRIVEAAASGEIPPDIAAQLVSAVASVVKIEEVENLKARLEALERVTKERK